MTQEVKLEKIKQEREELLEKINDPNMCEGTCQCFSRITGYYRPLDNWNVGKKSELKDRSLYNL